MQRFYAYKIASDIFSYCAVQKMLSLVTVASDSGCEKLQVTLTHYSHFSRSHTVIQDNEDDETKAYLIVKIIYTALLATCLRTNDKYREIRL